MDKREIIGLSIGVGIIFGIMFFISISSGIKPKITMDLKDPPNNLIRID